MSLENAPDDVKLAVDLIVLRNVPGNSSSQKYSVH
ncbi:Protein of uncharacterised function (DUF2496) [Escherichia coli]|nr:DUF2496 domain-containing protein [Escherichia coli]SQY54447.1 Protein of uncharacterised function (DUF2496) [Escherichia coli]SQY97175.1 Protein of uncharacterised function (DUF2496) [Escherichia coli]